MSRFMADEIVAFVPEVRNAVEDAQQQLREKFPTIDLGKIMYTIVRSTSGGDMWCAFAQYKQHGFVGFSEKAS